jgi:hypothetical protein
MAPALGFQPEFQLDTHSSRPIWIFRHNLYGIQILSLRLNLLHVHRMNIASSSAVSYGGALFGLLRDEPRMTQKMSQDYAANCASRIANGHP